MGVFVAVVFSLLARALSCRVRARSAVVPAVAPVEPTLVFQTSHEPEKAVTHDAAVALVVMNSAMEALRAEYNDLVGVLKSARERSAVLGADLEASQALAESHRVSIALERIATAAVVAEAQKLADAADSRAAAADARLASTEAALTALGVERDAAVAAAADSSARADAADSRSAMADARAAAAESTVAALRLELEHVGAAAALRSTASGAVVHRRTPTADWMAKVATRKKA